MYADVSFELHTAEAATAAQINQLRTSVARRLSDSGVHPNEEHARSAIVINSRTVGDDEHLVTVQTHVPPHAAAQAEALLHIDSPEEAGALFNEYGSFVTSTPTAPRSGDETTFVNKQGTKLGDLVGGQEVFDGVKKVGMLRRHGDNVSGMMRSNAHEVNNQQGLRGQKAFLAFKFEIKDRHFYVGCWHGLVPTTRKTKFLSAALHDVVIKHMQETAEGLPYIIAGDFNTTLKDDSMKPFKEYTVPAYNDDDTRCNHRAKQKYDEKAFSSRIDHILVSKNPEIKDPDRLILTIERTMRLPLLQTLKDNNYLFPNRFDQGSDHMPIAADIRITTHNARLHDPDPDGHSLRPQPLRPLGTIRNKHRKDKDGNFRVF